MPIGNPIFPTVMKEMWCDSSIGEVGLSEESQAKSPLAGSIPTARQWTELELLTWAKEGPVLFPFFQI